jgi:hypothetical protein
MLTKKEAEKLKRRLLLEAERDVERAKRNARLRKYVAKQPRKASAQKPSKPKKDFYALGKRVRGSFGSRQSRGFIELRLGRGLPDFECIAPVVAEQAI